MNGFFVIGGELYTAAAAEDHGTILPGVTRRSVIELAKDWGIPVHEGRISIDTITEHLIQNAIEHLMKGRTSFVIAHRLSTIRQADIILVVDAGKIIERGTHEELMAKKGHYYTLYTRQFEQEAVEQAFS